ncbi:MAG: cob(I)yrinic acid a,c-diamide adenosyltransferase [Verrucomicrobia bacterium]|nr:cob(I)yrinic acid a,c-diamide adenosyltransferase [Verrucomicrobiota bacterium]
MRLDKLYTRTGDDGRTSLVTGERVSKSCLRVDVFGTIDELNAWIGMLRTDGDAPGSLTRDMQPVLKRIQQDLFDIGSILATNADGDWPGKPVIDASRVAGLEASTDACQHGLDPLPSFVLPGGCPANAHAHVARTVCRRAERLLWRLQDEANVPDEILPYINRLSDFLFAYSRWASRVSGCEEYLWDQPRKG